VSKLERIVKHEWLAELQHQATVAGISILAQCIESAGQGNSIPDAYVCLNKKQGWLEFKRIAELSKPTVKYEPGQQNRLRRLHHNHGVFAATVGVTDMLDFVIALPNKTLLCTEGTYSNLCTLPIWKAGSEDAILSILTVLMDDYYKS
jgi:hypothetical protein